MHSGVLSISSGVQLFRCMCDWVSACVVLARVRLSSPGPISPHLFLSPAVFGCVCVGVCGGGGGVGGGGWWGGGGVGGGGGGGGVM